jgi:quercetin dioxygenase-like cupin family protein
MKNKIIAAAAALTICIMANAQNPTKLTETASEINQTAGRAQLGEFHLATDARQRFEQDMIFPIGNPNTAYAKYFIGNSYLAPISTEQVPIYNVTFEPGCRNNWHIHHATKGGGQMLICVAGYGWYQEEGKPARKLQPGDVVNIPANVKHWHGAAADSWFAHLAVEIPGENTSNEWCEPVTDAEYNNL